jgi:sporulation protein YlmC with PRC-barrel domain
MAEVLNMRTELTSLMDLKVYTDKGKYVGKVDDVIIDPNEKRISALAIGDVNRDVFDVPAKGIRLPYRWVLAVGDIIIIKQPIARAKPQPAPETRK